MHPPGDSERLLMKLEDSEININFSEILGLKELLVVKLVLGMCHGRKRKNTRRFEALNEEGTQAECFLDTLEMAMGVVHGDVWIRRGLAEGLSDLGRGERIGEDLMIR
ncbi:hypothetical protein Tco_0159221 [Tanacetum coccineum]